ncbi:hypothetical protein MRB53_037415 [Persea americana]|nr:hypothetical protein MRB53_037415 [Persea americana]
MDGAVRCVGMEGRKRREAYLSMAGIWQPTRLGEYGSWLLCRVSAPNTGNISEKESARHDVKKWPRRSGRKTLQHSFALLSPPCHDMGSVSPTHIVNDDYTSIKHESRDDQGPQYSPLTPSNATAAPSYIDVPPPLSIADSDNPDAVAVRAAIGVLQLQREKAKQNIKTLEDLKQRANDKPAAFLDDLMSGKLTDAPKGPFDPLAATLEDSSDDEADDVRAGQAQQSATSQFPKIPAAQQVFRCPPVNWDKYHVVGESLDRMHERQRRRPGSGDSNDATEHRIFAPYSPLDDTLPSTTTATMLKQEKT